MGSTFRYLTLEAESHLVLDWFRTQPDAPDFRTSPRSVLLFFRSLGPLTVGGDGDADPKRSPIVTVFPPARKRGALLSAGEVHFLAKADAIPGLRRVSARFGRWLKQFPVVFSSRAPEVHEWDHLLEGSLRNFDPPIHAFPAAYEALVNGSQYFVADGDGDVILDKLCKSLRLRGVQCGDA